MSKGVLGGKFMSNIKQTYTHGALTMRLIIGIFSILLSVIIGVQSIFAGLGEALTKSDSNGGAAGFILGFFMLAAGIVTIAARKTKGGTITSIVVYSLGGIIAVFNQSEIFGDLIIWTVVSFIFAVLLIVSLFMKYKVSNNQHSREEQIIENIKLNLDNEESFNQSKPKKKQQSDSIPVLIGFFLGMLFTIVIILTAAIILTYTSGDKIKDFFSGDKSSTVVKNDSESKIAGVGETVSSDNWKVTLRYAKQYTEIESKDSSYTDKPNDGKIYLVTFFEAENISDKEDYFNPLYISASVDGYEADMKILLNKPEGEENISGNVAPGKKTKGFIAFEVKPSWRDFEITYRDDITEGSKKLSFQIHPEKLN